MSPLLSPAMACAAPSGPGITMPVGQALLAVLAKQFVDGASTFDLIFLIFLPKNPV